MTQIVSNPNMLPAGMVVNVNRQIVPAFVNATPTHRNMAPQFVINNRPIRITQQVIQGTRPSNVTIFNFFLIYSIYSIYY